MLNINGSTDPSYRYKMPRVVGKVEGRGNGIKTVIVNCREVASSLKRPTEQLTKFIGLQMGASSRIEHDKSIVNGAIDTADLQKLVTVYIEKFVLCPKCGNPETVQKLAASGGGKKSTVVVLKCKACGETTDADNSHRLITLIVKELTDSSTKEKKSEKKKDTTEVVGLKNNAEAQNEATAAADEENTKAVKKSGKKSKGEKKPAKKADKQALKQAAERISAKLDFLVQADSDAPLDGDAVVEEATALCKELGLDVKDSLVQVVWKAAVTLRNAKPSSSVEQFAPVLSAVAREGKKNPARILKCAADYSGEDEKVIKSIPLAVKALYDTDVCTEEDILLWFEKAKLDSRVKKTLKPLIEWLEAEDDSSEEEEEDDEDESSEDDDEEKKRSNSTSSDNSSANSSDED